MCLLDSGRGPCLRRHSDRIEGRESFCDGVTGGIRDNNGGNAPHHEDIFDVLCLARSDVLAGTSYRSADVDHRLALCMCDGILGLAHFMGQTRSA
jgi:hypothetical protein